MKLRRAVLIVAGAAGAAVLPRRDRVNSVAPSQ
jgi:hypothetical protein